MTVTVSPRNLAIAALFGILTAVVVQPAPEAAKIGDKGGSCAISHCLPASSDSAPPQPAPAAEPEFSFDI